MSYLAIAIPLLMIASPVIVVLALVFLLISLFVPGWALPALGILVASLIWFTISVKALISGALFGAS